MDGVTMWVLGILTTICMTSITTCFVIVLKSKGSIQALEIEMNNRPNYQFISSEFYKKEVAILQFQPIQDKFNLIQSDIKEIKDDFNGIIERLDKFIDRDQK